MRAHIVALLVAASLALVACQPSPDRVVAPTPAPTVTGVETLDVTIPGSLHAQGLAVPGKLVRPKWSAPAGKKPAMVVLHGSGGLLKMPTQAGSTCSPTMEAQFVEWGNRLASKGYTVLLPSSYSARGFCDAHTDTERIPSNFDTDIEQNIGRVYDMDAATRYLCGRPEVDCSRMGMLGFSEGATITMLALHHKLDHALSYFRQTKASEVGFPIVDLKPGRPSLRAGVAYYPGCYFDGLIPPSTTASALPENKYSATAPLTVLHGGQDSLIKHCSVAYGVGTRQVQSAQVGSVLKVADNYQITVYPNATHGFATPGTTGADGSARLAAQDVTMAKLAAQVAGSGN